MYIGSVDDKSSVVAVIVEDKIAAMVAYTYSSKIIKKTDFFFVYLYSNRIILRNYHT